MFVKAYAMKPRTPQRVLKMHDVCGKQLNDTLSMYANSLSYVRVKKVREWNLE